MSTVTDLALNLLNGDDSAVAVLYEALYQRGLYIARQHVKTNEDAEDAFQDSFMKAIANIDKWDSNRAFEPWFDVIIVNTCKNMVIRKDNSAVTSFTVMNQTVGDDDSRENAFENTLVSDDLGAMPEAVMDMKALKEIMDGIVCELPLEQRQTLFMFYYREMSLAQIAEETEVEVNTVKSRLNYARKKVKAAVEDYEKEHKIKLHTIAPIPLIYIFYRSSLGPSPAAAATASSVSVSVGAGATSSQAGIGIAARAGFGIAAKLAIGVAAVAIGVGAGAGIATITRDSETNNSANESAMISEDSQAVEEIEVDRNTEKPEQTMSLIEKQGQRNFVDFEIDGMGFTIGKSTYQNALDAFGIPDRVENYYSAHSDVNLYYTDVYYYFYNDEYNLAGLEKCKYIHFKFVDLQDGALALEDRVLYQMEITNEHGDLSYDPSFDENAYIDFCDIILYVNDDIGTITNSTTTQEILSRFQLDLDRPQGDYSEKTPGMKDYVTDGFRISIEFTDQGAMPEPKALYRIALGYETNISFGGQEQ